MLISLSETKKLTAPMIKQEEASKYRCKECNKLFKAPEFVMKHIIVKHGEGVQTKLDEVSILLPRFHQYHSLYFSSQHSITLF